MEDAATKTVFVGNLSWGVTDEALAEHMSAAGTIVSASVQCHEDTGRSKGWGLVEYSTSDEAAAAIETLNNSDLSGRAVHVRLDRSRIESSGGYAVFVGNLPWSTNDADLATLFNDYEPYDAHVKTNMAGRSRGFAIVRFSDEAMAQKAIKDLNGYQIEGRPIQVRGDREPSEGAAGEEAGRGGRTAGRGGRGAPGAAAEEPTGVVTKNCIYVRNLAWSTTDEDLLAHFSQCPGAQSAEVQVATSGRSKGWALVTFETMEQAEEAAVVMNNSILHERNLTVRLARK